MDPADILNKATIAVLYEANSQGIDIQELVKQAKGGLMGSRTYAHASAEAKPKTVAALQGALEDALNYIEIDQPAG